MAAVGVQLVGAGGEEDLLKTPPKSLQLLPVAICACDGAGRLCWFNARAAALWGRTPRIGDDEELYCGSYKLYGLDGSPMRRAETPMAEVLATGNPAQGKEIVILRPDGSRIVVMVHIDPVTDRSGRLLGAINCFQETTTLHRTRDELSNSARRLLQAESQQRLLVAELNHRVKNNMQMLDSLLRAAHRETTSPEAKAVLADASQKVGAMAAAQQVLYDSGTSLKFRASEFLESVCASAKRQFANRANIILNASQELLTNDVAMPLALIVNELVINAMKHGYNGSEYGSVRVDLGKGTGEWILSVEDDGPGFELTKVRKRSSGLGLVTGLVNQIGGTFGVERRSGARCTVRFLDHRSLH